jgi:hypothetical protein
VADHGSPNDSSLALFLESFSHNTRLFSMSAAELVNELSALWEARYPPPPEPGPNPAPVPLPGPNGGRMPNEALLISYCSKDRAAAENLRKGLSTVTDVWLDVDQLEAGDNWELEINRAIRNCTLFFPVISRTAAGIPESFFRREWKAAVRRLGGIDGIPFVVPVLVDDVEFDDPGVPPDFWAAQGARLPGGVTTPEFLRQVAAKVQQIRKRRAG